MGLDVCRKWDVIFLQNRMMYSVWLLCLLPFCSKTFGAQNDTKMEPLMREDISVNLTGSGSKKCAVILGSTPTHHSQGEMARHLSYLDVRMGNILWESSRIPAQSVPCPENWYETLLWSSALPSSSTVDRILQLNKKLLISQRPKINSGLHYNFVSKSTWAFFWHLSPAVAARDSSFACRLGKFCNG